MRQSSIVIHRGKKEEKYELYVEDYVISFLKKKRRRRRNRSFSTDAERRTAGNILSTGPVWTGIRPYLTNMSC